ncbi:M48 family metalloprotease [Streptomyces sp. NPDC052000]|uniref:M48 family metalloprotease n=1 Tax=Streptomyces sp. NPDC052000 TaxID=3155676 RepID=UPI00344D6E18
MTSRPTPLGPSAGRPVSAGTTVRFALLVILILAASGLMLLDVAYWWVSTANSSVCSLASGIDPDRHSDLGMLVQGTTQAHAYTACMQRYAPPPLWWIPLSWLAVVCAAAGVLFFWLPVWKARRGRVVPLAVVDGDGNVGKVLEEVAAVAGLTRLPRLVVDPAAASVGALVFGRNGRPVVCLHGGLLARRHRDPKGFRAVLLHEFAHVRNGDVTLTYATVALWRVFLVLVAPPYLTGLAMYLVGVAGASSPPLAQTSRSVLQVVVLVVLVYLARADVLRSREVHADRTAVRWGADPGGWHVAASPGTGGAAARVLGSFAALWRTHPRWDVRRGALADAAPVYGVPGLPLFLTGASAVLIGSQLSMAIGAYQHGSNGLLAPHLAGLVAAGLVTGVSGTVLWRAVVHAVLTGRRPPSGPRAGLWLGAGMAAGSLIAGQGTIAQFFPSRNALLVAFLLGGPAFAWWTAQCAELWAKTWRGRTLRPVLAVGLAAGGLALWQWFAWWYGNGAALGTGWWYDTAGIKQMLAQTYPGPAADHRTMLAGISVVYPFILILNSLPFVAIGTGSLGIVSLAAWAARRPPAVRPWTRDAMGDIEGAAEPPVEEPPRLRRVLLPGLLGGLAAWAVVPAVLAGPWAGLSRAPTWNTQLAWLLVLAWLWLTLVILAVASSVVAALAARRYRLLAALIAAQTTVLVGMAGPVVLLIFDGCVGPLSVSSASCDLRPSRVLLQWGDLHQIVGFTMMTATVASVIVAAAVSVMDRMRAAHRAADGAGTGPQPARRPGVRRLFPAAACLLALAVLSGEAVYRLAHIPRSGSQLAGSTARAMQSQFRRMSPQPASAPVTPRTKSRQVQAWGHVGGYALLDRFTADQDRIIAIVQTAAAHKEPLTALVQVRPICESIGQTATDAALYFDVPDPQGNNQWQAFMLNAAQSTLDCRTALGHLTAGRMKEAHDAFRTSFGKIYAAQRYDKAVDARIAELKRAGEGNP